MTEWRHRSALALASPQEDWIYAVTKNDNLKVSKNVPSSERGANAARLRLSEDLVSLAVAGRGIHNCVCNALDICQRQIGEQDRFQLWSNHLQMSNEQQREEVVEPVALPKMRTTVKQFHSREVSAKEPIECNPHPRAQMHGSCQCLVAGVKPFKHGAIAARMDTWPESKRPLGLIFRIAHR